MAPFWASLRVAASEAFQVRDESHSLESETGINAMAKAKELVLPLLEENLREAGYAKGLREYMAVGQAHGDERSHPRLRTGEVPQQQQRQWQRRRQRLRGARTYVVGKAELRASMQQEK